MVTGCIPQTLHFYTAGRLFPFIFLYRRQAVSVYFPVEVEGIYIGHAGNIVEYGLYFSEQAGRMDVVLGGNAVDEQLGVGFFRKTDCVNHEVYQGSDDPVTGQFNIDHILGTVNLGEGRA